MPRQEPTRFGNLFFLLFLLLVLPVIVWLALTAQDIRQRASESTPIYLIPSKEKALPGETLGVAIQIKTNTAPVTGVQINLTYPQEKLSQPTITYTNSAFQVTSEQILGPGMIRIARDNTVPVTGYQQVAQIQFDVKSEVTPQEISLAPGSYATSHDNKSLPVSLVIADAAYYEDIRKANQNFFDFLLSFINSINPLTSN